MASVLIIHAQDSSLEAILLKEKLIYSGFPVLTLEDVYGHASWYEINRTRYDVVEDALAVIVLASYQLFSNPGLVSMALIGREDRGIIPVVFRHELEHPPWFVSPITLTTGFQKSPHGWNKLNEALVQRAGNLFWQQPQALNN